MIIVHSNKNNQNTARRLDSFPLDHTDVVIGEDDTVLHIVP